MDLVQDAEGIAPLVMKTQIHPLCFLLTVVSLNLAPVISAQPASIDYQSRSQTVILYQPAAFGVIASGTAPLSYQWRRDGVPIAGATNDQIVLAHPQFSDAGVYSVVVSNAEGSLTSADVTLAVTPPKAGDVYYFFAIGSSKVPRPGYWVGVQRDGKVLSGGGGGIARLNADGSTDHTFMNGLSGANGTVNSVALQSDGKVLIG